VCSGTQADTYARIFGVSSARFPLLPDCCLPGWVSPVHPRMAPDDGYVFIGGVAYRDWSTALEAARLASDIEFVFAAFSKFWRNVALPANVTVKLDLSLDEFDDCMARARVVAIPLLGEVTAGLIVLINAVLRGKLVIATRTSITELYVPAGCRDVLVPMSEPESLAATIRRYCADDEDRLACAIECQDFVVTTHSAQEYTRQLMDVIEEMDESSGHL
jgi:glycosyltransferase involved in cell wall biosynthesis